MSLSSGEFNMSRARYILTGTVVFTLSFVVIWEIFFGKNTSGYDIFSDALKSQTEEPFRFLSEKKQILNQNNKHMHDESQNNTQTDLPPVPPTSKQPRSYQANVLGQDTNTTSELYNNSHSEVPNSCDFVNRKTPYPAYWMDCDYDLTKRLQAYNQAIGELRDKILNKRAHKDWTNPFRVSVLLWGAQDDFVEQVSQFQHIKTLVLSWLTENSKKPWTSLSDTRNMLLQTFHDWVASEPLCTWIKTPEFTKARWDAVFNKTCTTDMSASMKDISLAPLFLHAKPINVNHYWPNKGKSYPSYFYTDPPKEVLYLHILEDAIVTDIGAVLSKHVKLVPYTCSHDISTEMPQGYMDTAIYNEVFVISGGWGNEYFHSNSELLPRIAPYLEFLKAHPSVTIQVGERRGHTARILDMLGINEDRLVQGVLRAKVVYLPQGTPCGFARVLPTQILSRLYHQQITTKIIPEIINDIKKHNSTSAESLLPAFTERNNLVMIHRSGSRQIQNGLSLEIQVKQLAEEYGLRFILFHDQQLPRLEDAMTVFYQAVFIVAPHGAGLSNVLFAQPGTFVVEIVCNPPHVNMCFQHLNHILGMRYHAIPSRGGCENHVEVNEKELLYVVRGHLDQWQSMGGGD